LPPGSLDYQGVRDFFRNAFGVGDDGAVALLGAHTLGNMARRASGYTGQWKEDLNDKVLSNNKAVLRT